VVCLVDGLALELFPPRIDTPVVCMYLLDGPLVMGQTLAGTFSKSPTSSASDLSRCLSRGRSMNIQVRTFVQPLLIGVGAVILSFVAMDSSTPVIMYISTAALYLAAGFWMGRIQPKSLLLAPLFANICIWVVFIPMGMEIWPPVIHIWYFLVPPPIALVCAYVGMNLGIRTTRAKQKPVESAS
jgi:hypothetical protein